MTQAYLIKMNFRTGLTYWSGSLSAIGCECLRNDYDQQPSTTIRGVCLTMKWTLEKAEQRDRNKWAIDKRIGALD